MTVDLTHLHTRSKSDLLALIDALVSEDPERRAIATHREQKKAAGRIVAIQRLLAQNGRYKNRLTRARSERIELLNLLPEPVATEWIASKKRARRTDAV